MIDLPPNKLIERVQERNSRCRCYRDEGLAVNGKAIIKFATEFTRAPEAFRFEYSVDHEGLGGGRSSLFLSQSGKTSMKTSDGAEVEFADLPTALGQITGAASFVSMFLKRLLFTPFEDESWQRFMPYEYRANAPQPASSVLVYGSQDETGASEILEIDEKSLCVVNLISLPANLPNPGLEMVARFPGNARDFLSKFLEKSETDHFSIRMTAAELESR